MIQTCVEFNEKYIEFLEEGHNGLTIEIPGVVVYLDRLFGDLTKIPGFKYSHIIRQHGLARFHNSLPELLPYVGMTMDKAIEERLNFMITVEREIEQRLANN